MRLTQFTDLGVRVMMYVSKKEATEATTITELSKKFDTSRNHLVKVVQFLSNNGLLNARRGRGGGLTLNAHPSEIRIGHLIYLLEQTDCVINCEDRKCVLRSGCLLKSALSGAYRAFIDYLDQYTLEDVTGGKTGLLLQKMLISV